MRLKHLRGQITYVVLRDLRSVIPYSAIKMVLFSQRIGRIRPESATTHGNRKTEHANVGDQSMSTKWDICQLKPKPPSRILLGRHPGKRTHNEHSGISPGTRFSNRPARFAHASVLSCVDHGRVNAGRPSAICHAVFSSCSGVSGLSGDV